MGISSSSSSRTGRKPATVFPANIDQIVPGDPSNPPPTFIGNPQTTLNQKGKWKWNVSLTICVVIACFAFVASIAVFLAPSISKFHVQSATVSPIIVTRTTLSATWDITFLVRNPNRGHRVDYFQTEARILFGTRYLLTYSQLPNFYQKRVDDQTTLHARLSLASGRVDPAILADISKEMANGTVSFDVGLVLVMRYKRTAWRQCQHLLRVYCDDLRFEFPLMNTDGFSEDVIKPCKVTW